MDKNVKSTENLFVNVIFATMQVAVVEFAAKIKSWSKTNPNKKSL